MSGVWIFRPNAQRESIDGNLPFSSPPNEQATAGEDQAGQTGADDGTGNSDRHVPRSHLRAGAEGEDWAGRLASRAAGEARVGGYQTEERDDGC